MAFDASCRLSDILEGSKVKFGFGKNWMGFLSVINEERIRIAEGSLKEMLQQDHLIGKSFLDIGSGSGLFSLAARRLGAYVHSFDYDSLSVACTQELKNRYFPQADEWIIEKGSALDKDYLNSLGVFDYVYSWGVLHHTGDMWQALQNVLVTVGKEGRLVIAIYNDQGPASRRWHRVKRTYNRVPMTLKAIIVSAAFIRLWGPTMIKDLGRLKPLHTWRNYNNFRGMSPWYDLVDWVGGYPFDVAKPEDIFGFYHQRGLILIKLTTCGGGLGCNEFVFFKP